MKSQRPFQADSVSNMNYPCMSAEGSSSKYQKTQGPLIRMKLTFKKYPAFARVLDWLMGIKTIFYEGEKFLARRESSYQVSA